MLSRTQAAAAEAAAAEPAAKGGKGDKKGKEAAKPKEEPVEEAADDSEAPLPPLWSELLEAAEAEQAGLQAHADTDLHAQLPKCGASTAWGPLDLAYAVIDCLRTGITSRKLCSQLHVCRRTYLYSRALLTDQIT
eukprot:2875448-Pleurochrysis_carterae.AAC.1